MELTAVQQSVLDKVHAYNRGTLEQDLKWISKHIAGIDGMSFGDIANYTGLVRPAQRYIGHLTTDEIQAFKELAKLG